MRWVADWGRGAGILMGTLALPLLLASCSGSSTSATTGPTTTVTSTDTTSHGSASTADQTACVFISPSDIKATMGVTVGRPKSSVRGAVTTCTYRSADLSHSVIIEYDTAATASSFAADRSTVESHKISVTSLSGLGDQAYSFSETSGQNIVNSVVAFQGALQTIVTGTSSSDKVEAMAAEILNRIDAHDAATSATPPG
jgi:hypothetical protein